MRGSRQVVGGSDSSTMQCPACGRRVPGGSFCVVCGQHLSAGRRRLAYAAAPHEHVLVPEVISTIFPHLPRRHLGGFRGLLGVGVGASAALAYAHLFVLSLTVAASVLPILALLYIVEVDLYESEPVKVFVATLAWGAVAGYGVTHVLASTAPGPAMLVGRLSGRYLLWHCVAIPAISVAAACLGPAVLLGWSAFNDVLDGATFGVASAAAFVAVQSTTQIAPLVHDGFTTAGRTDQWFFHTMEVAVLAPTVFISGVAGLMGLVWLRVRAPVPRGHRFAGGPASLVMGAAFAVGGVGLSTLAAINLPRLTGAVVIVGIGVAGLLWLRMIVHLGLLQESWELPIGETRECPNCGEPTAIHSFCSNCGVALAALPKERT